MKGGRIIRVKFNKIGKVLTIVIVFSVIILLYTMGFSSNRYLKFFLVVLMYTLVPSLVTFGIGLRILNKVKENNNKVYIYKILINIFVIIVLIISVYFTMPYYKDIPTVATSNYSSVKGTITDVIISGKGDSDMDFNINGVWFSCYRWDFDDLVEGEIYEITYLENSKYIMGIHRIF